MASPDPTYPAYVICQCCQDAFIPDDDTSTDYFCPVCDKELPRYRKQNILYAIMYGFEVPTPTILTEE